MSKVSKPKLYPVSCLECRRRKIKCNRLDPCDQCTKRFVQCNFPRKFRNTHLLVEKGSTDLRSSREEDENVSQATKRLGKANHVFDTHGNFYGNGAAIAILAEYSTSSYETSRWFPRSNTTAKSALDRQKFSIPFVFDDLSRNYEFLKTQLHAYFEQDEIFDQESRDFIMSCFEECYSFVALPSTEPPISPNVEYFLTIQMILTCQLRKLNRNDPVLKELRCTANDMSSIYFSAFMNNEPKGYIDRMNQLRILILKIEQLLYLKAQEEAWRCSYESVAIAYSLGLHVPHHSIYNKAIDAGTERETGNSTEARDRIWVRIQLINYLQAIATSRPAAVTEVYYGLDLRYSDYLRSSCRLVCILRKLLKSKLQIAPLPYDMLLEMDADISNDLSSVLDNRNADIFRKIVLHSVRAVAHRPYITEKQNSAMTAIQSCISLFRLSELYIVENDGRAMLALCPFGECYVYLGLIVTYVMIRLIGDRSEYSEYLAELCCIVDKLFAVDVIWRENTKSLAEAIQELSRVELLTPEDDNSTGLSQQPKSTAKSMSPGSDEQVDLDLLFNIYEPFLFKPSEF